MHVVSVNVGLPRGPPGGAIRSTPASSRTRSRRRSPLRRLNLDGDRQADLTVHGGPDKAVYAYPSEHYDHWRRELPAGPALGAFGENLTTEGLIEDEVHIGDGFRVGSASWCHPTPACPASSWGSGSAAQDDQAVPRAGRRVLLAVVHEGEVGAGDPIERSSEDKRRVAVTEVAALIYDREAPPEALRRALQVPALAASIREELEARLAD